MLCSHGRVSVRPCHGRLSLVSSLWTAWAWSMLPVLLLATATTQQVRADCSPRLCGGVNISWPFGIVADHATQTNCGIIGFQVLCSNNNTTPYLGSYYNTSYSFRILNIFYDTASLLVADVHKLRDFRNRSGGSNSKRCHSPTNNSSAKLGFPFSISPANQDIIFYGCAEPPSPADRRSRGLVDTACGNTTLVGVARSADVSGSYGGEFLEGCNSTVVPVLARSGSSGKVNAADYLELIRGGFLLTWELRQSPPQLLPPPTPAGMFTSGIISMERIA